MTRMIDIDSAGSRRRTTPLRAAILPAALLLAALACAEAGAVVVTEADDVCASSDNPCNVTTQMDIPPGLCTDNPSITCSTNSDCTPPDFCKLGAVVLDFGVRDVNVSGSGQFNFGFSSGSILCGDFTATTTGNAIDATDSGDSGTVRISSRRLCSAAHLPDYPAPPCVSNTDCTLGECGTRRCSLGTTKVCLSDPDCSLGPCIQNGLNKSCTKDSGRRCLNNADCELGSCPGQLTCKNRGENPVECSTNSDCNFGSCTVGTASINLAGPVVGNSVFPAFIDLRAADNISISKTVNLAGTTADSDGGELSADATFGSVSVTGKITATSGGFSTGGDVSLYAGTDVNITEEIDLTGGDYDGGTIDVDAGRDVQVSKSILANAGAGAGYGGEFLIVAGRDLSVTGVSAANKTSLETNGRANLFNEAGDGGAQDLTADRHLSLGANTRIISNGAAPDAVGGDIILDASGNFTYNGDVTAKALGANGDGGTLECYAGGTMNIGTGGTIDLTGGSGAGGDLQIYSTGNLTYSGLANVGASNGGSGGAAYLDSDADASIAGTLRIATGDNGSLDVNACRITLTATGFLDGATTTSDNTLTARESMKLLSGSQMKAGAGGTNRLVYRTASKPPQTSGTISPAAQLSVNGALVPCPVCGNNELDGGETCEDGNTVNGDGCNSQCQNENCVAQTAAKIACSINADCGSARTCVSGFCSPWDLCEDGNVCTTDTCNTSLNGGTCQHAAKNCADVHACTTDSCNPTTGVCQHVGNDAACNDGNPCTDETCNSMTGCVPTDNTDPCNDGNSCTENDMCFEGECDGTPIGGCGFCGDGALNGDEVCDDGNATFVNGEYCGVDCAVLIPCGKPTNSSGTLPKSSDAQFTLRAAVGQATCSLRVCDVDNTTKVVASDAQRILRKAVGQTVTLTCPTS